MINNHQSRRLENLKFSLQEAKMRRNVDVKLLSAGKLQLVRCYADTSKLQWQWAPSLPPPSECCQVWTEIRPNLTTHSGLRRCRSGNSGNRYGTALLRLQKWQRCVRRRLRIFDFSFLFTKHFSCSHPVPSTSGSRKMSLFLKVSDYHAHTSLLCVLNT